MVVAFVERFLGTNAAGGMPEDVAVGAPTPWTIHDIGTDGCMHSEIHDSVWAKRTRRFYRGGEFGGDNEGTGNVGLKCTSSEAARVYTRTEIPDTNPGYIRVCVAIFSSD